MIEEEHIDRLIRIFAKLPFLGPRSATKIVLHLLANNDYLLKPLSILMTEVSQSIHQCTQCGNLSLHTQCEICSNPKRQTDVICVVEQVSDLWAIEHSNIFQGTYHVLGGTLSAFSGNDPETLNINSLVQRIQQHAIHEVILATSPTVEGQTTANYIYALLEELQQSDLTISSLAYGIPLGSELDNLDNSTLEIAFHNRKNINTI